MIIIVIVTESMDGQKLEKSLKDEMAEHCAVCACAQGMTSCSSVSNMQGADE